MMMHILIITGIFPPDIGGSATYAPQMAMILGGMGCSRAIWSGGERCRSPDLQGLHSLKIWIVRRDVP
jgi:hypothetical protein